jgi:hypothetical protein
MFVELGENWNEKSSILGEKEELGLENLWQCRSTPKTSNMDQNHKKLNKSRDQNSRQIGAIF